jgi:NAD(P)H-flavin reductase
MLKLSIICTAFRCTSSFKPFTLMIRRSTPLFMASEGFFDAKILNNIKNAEGIRFMEIEAPVDVKAGFKTPGQYVQMKKDVGKPGFYAIASSPLKNTFEFIVKETPNNEFLLNTKIGETIEMSLPQGKGYQIQEFFEKYKFDFPTTNVHHPYTLH